MSTLPNLLAPLQNLLVTSQFGPRILAGIDSTFHPGVDYAAPLGTAVMAAAAGTVIFAGQQTGYGNVVIVDHGGGVVSKYGHLSAFDVQAGQTVAAGEQIAESGATGNATGPHLHFEVDVNGVAVDPSSALVSGSWLSVAPDAVSADTAAADGSGDSTGLTEDPTVAIAVLAVVGLGIWAVTR